MKERIFANWKTTAVGVLAFAAVIVGVLAKNHPAWAWIPDAVGIINGASLFLAKDK